MKKDRTHLLIAEIAGEVKALRQALKPVAKEILAIDHDEHIRRNIDSYDDTHHIEITLTVAECRGVLKALKLSKELLS